MGWGWGGVSVLQVGKSGREAPLSKDYFHVPREPLQQGWTPAGEGC